jgi:NAD(P)-dependent dehydrogenase (short-subunit alcohol dehydrogenase family)
MASEGHDALDGRAVVVTGEAMVSRCVREFGKLDGFINNAGIFPMAPILEMSTDIWDKVHRLNQRGLALACQAAGDISNTGSYHDGQ